MNKKLLIIDGNSLINRAFYALPYLTNSKGQFTGAVFGFTNMLIKVLANEQPTNIIVAFDHARKTFRNEMYEAYKGTRKPTPPELIQQMQALKELLDVMQIAKVQKAGIEADDIIGTIVSNFDGQCLILSGDKDVFQLVNDKVSVIVTKKGITETELITPQSMPQLYSYKPSMVVELKALMGDSSDNIPGVAGVGPKTALKLLEDYKSLDGVFENLADLKGALKEKLEANKDLAYLSKKLATIKTDCDLDGFDIYNTKLKFPFDKAVVDAFKLFEFNSLLSRNELFEEGVETKEVKKIKFEKIEISSVEDLQKQVVLNKESATFAFDFLKTKSVAFNQSNSLLLNFDINLFNEGLDIESVLKDLKPVLENEKILKITSNLKEHLHLFLKNDIALKGEIFDVSIAQYLINPGIKTTLAEPFAVELFEKMEVLKNELIELELLDLYKNMELPLCYVLTDMELEGFKIDTKELEELSIKYEKELAELTGRIHFLANEEFNVNSPKQVGEILFNKLGLKAWDNKKNSTNIDVLNELYNEHEIVPLIIKYRKLFKLNSSYIESYKQIVKESGNVIHTVFNQTLTSTGRLSSSEPNLQNIPIRDDEGKNLRKLFISKHKNGSIISADYNQIELRLLASFSNDENMIKAYLNNKDIHSITASQIFGVKLEAVTQNMRREAKAVNFGIVYGISDYGLSVSIGTTRKKAKDYIDKYFETYSGVKAYMDQNIENAKKVGMVRTLFNRVRKVPEINSSRFQLRQFAERVAMNMPLQGSASDIIKLAMIKVFETFKEKKLKSKLILQVHDELIVDALENEAEQVKQILTSCMENVVKLSVPLPAVVSSGKTWFDCK